MKRSKMRKINSNLMGKSKKNIIIRYSLQVKKMQACLKSKSKLKTKAKTLTWEDTASYKKWLLLLIKRLLNMLVNLQLQSLHKQKNSHNQNGGSY